MLLRHAAATDVGRVRDHNEDSYATENGDGRNPHGALFVVCDGMGGHARGEVASEVAAKTIAAYYNEHPQADLQALLRDAFAAANGEVLRQGHGDMGTTAVAVIVRHNAAMIANVGDCRAYLVHDGQARQVSRDHSFVAEQVAAGILTAEQAKESSYRNIVTRAIGNRGELEVDLYQEPLQVGDVLVLCSDGLHGLVEADEIALAVTKVPLDTACKKLVELANARGGPDNITIIAVKVEALDEGVPVVESSASTATITTGALATAATRATNGATTGSLARRAAVAPPLAPPVQRAGSGGIRWLATLLMVAALGIGGYSLYHTRTPAAPPPSPAAVAPTLTPLGATTATPDQLAGSMNETGTALLSDTLAITSALVTNTATLTNTAVIEPTAEPR